MGERAPRWKSRVQGYDAGSIDLLMIAEHFLVQYFGAPAARADELVDAFLALEVWDEDMLHQQMPYRTAAAVHFLVVLGRPWKELQAWLAEHAQTTPREALEYTHEHFWKKQQR